MRGKIFETYCDIYFQNRYKHKSLDARSTLSLHQDKKINQIHYSKLQNTHQEEKKLAVNREKTQITTVAKVAICPPEYILNLLEQHRRYWHMDANDRIL